MLKGSTGFAQNEIPRRCEIAVEINRADHRFEGVTQSGNARAAAAGLFAAAHQQMPAQVERLGMSLKRVARNQPRPQLRQSALLFLWEIGVKIFGDDKLQNRITEKLQALVVLVITLFFVGETWMRQCLLEQGLIAKMV